MSLLPVFDVYPEHGAAVGRLLAGYSELEIVLLYAVQGVRDSFDDVFKAMYRTRGEKQRIEIADALARHEFVQIGLGDQFAAAIGVMQYCRQIRNQFAHCAWYGDASGYLKFTALEEAARENTKRENWKDLTIRRLDVALLMQQLAYFEYVHDLLTWLKYEALRITKAGRNPFPVPATPKARPPLHTPSAPAAGNR